MMTRVRIGVAGLAATLAALSATSLAAREGSGLQIRVLSSRPDLITGGDARIEVAGGALDGLKVMLNGQDVTASLALDPQRQSAQGVVTGFTDGANQLSARTAAGRTASLNVVDHDPASPFLSGWKIEPFTCMTAQAGLGPSSGPNCQAPAKISYFYKAKDGKFHPLAQGQAKPDDVVETTTIDGVATPYIVRVETGVLGRNIYRVAVLDAEGAASPGAAFAAPRAWNRRLVIGFGGGCGANYSQGADTIEHVLSDPELSRGFAYAVSPTLINQQFCNPGIEAEAVSLIKERVIEEFGPIRWAAGSGLSGGSIQQYLIAEMFPGLIDGIQAGASYPDSQNQTTADCLLLNKAFASDQARWTPAKQDAVRGVTKSTCGDWSIAFGTTNRPVPGAIAPLVASVGGIRVPSPNPCGVSDPALLYSPSNPKGLRCSVFDFLAPYLGRDTAGKVRRPWDNVGVQYGLGALASGAISLDDFISLNGGIGGFDDEGNPVARRSVGDPAAIKAIYAAGLLNGFANVTRIPMVIERVYLDNAPAGALMAIHDRTEDLVIRTRLRKAAGGRVTSEVILTSGYSEAGRAHLAALDLLTNWLDAYSADPARPSLDKALRTRPSGAADTCWGPKGEKVIEPASFDGGGKCNLWYPLHPVPRMIAGSPLAMDVAKCALRPVRSADYPGASPAQVDAIRKIFPGGVCDYGKPSPLRVPRVQRFASLNGF